MPLRFVKTWIKFKWFLGFSLNVTLVVQNVIQTVAWNYCNPTGGNNLMKITLLPVASLQ